MDLWNTSNNSASDEAGGDGEGDGSKKRKHRHEHSKKAKKHKDKKKSHRSSEAVHDRKLNSAHDATNDSLGDAKGRSGMDESISRAAFLSSSNRSSSGTGVVAAASWRGNRDPALSQQSILNSGARLTSSIKGTDNSSSSQKPRLHMDSSLSGIGGLGRNR